MVHLEVELDGLQKHSLQGHHLLPRISAELTELLIIGETPDSFDQISTLFRRLFRLPGEEERAGCGHVAGELDEAVEHVEPVKVDRGRGHRVMTKA